MLEPQLATILTDAVNTLRELGHEFITTADVIAQANGQPYRRNPKIPLNKSTNAAIGAWLSENAKALGLEKASKESRPYKDADGRWTKAMVWRVLRT